MKKLKNSGFILTIVSFILITLVSLALSEYPKVQELKSTSITLQPKYIDKNEARLFDPISINERISTIFRLGNPITATGTSEVIIYDDFDNIRSEIQYYLQSDNGLRYRIYFDNPPKLISGKRITIDGIYFENEILARNYNIEEGSVAADPRNLGEQKTVVILINPSDDTSQPITTQQAYSKVFDNTNFNSINNYTIETSYGKAWLTGNLFGWYPIPNPESDLCTSGFFTIRDAAIQAADNDIDFLNYNRLFIVLPSPVVGCVSSSVGIQDNVNTDDGTATLSTTILTGTNTLDSGTSLHEFGHQLGLLHANGWECGTSTTGENCRSFLYNDLFDVMGLNAGKGHFNAFHKNYLGWFDNAIKFVEPLETGTSVYRISPLSTKTNGIKALKIQTNNGFSYNIEYRRPILHDAVISSVYGVGVYNGAMVHIDLANNTADTQLLDNSPHLNTSQDDFDDFANSSLRTGQTFTDQTNDVSLTVNAITNDYLEITCTGNNCAEQIQVPDQPIPEPSPIKKNRYISFIPTNPGKQTALRVKLTDLPTQFASFEGKYRWVGQPKNVTELSGSSGSTPLPIFVASKLECTPVYRDWNDVNIINVYGSEIIPGSNYDVQAIEQGCDVNDINCYSSSLIIDTSKWGDVVGTFNGTAWNPPDGRVDIATDVIALLDKFKNAPTAISKTRADLEPADLGQLKIDITDVSRDLDAFRGLQYPFNIDDSCSSKN